MTFIYQDGYDVYDKENQKYLLQSEVKRLSDELGFIYVNTFYNGRFISWEHCKLFMNKYCGDL